MEHNALHAFLADTLVLWGVRGEVTTGQDEVVAQIRAASGVLVWIEHARADTPFRWLVRWRAAGDASRGVRELRPRACSSLVGVLAAMREALGVERGTAVRIVPATVQS